MNLRTSMLLLSLTATTLVAGCMAPSSAKSPHGSMMHGGHSRMDMAKMCEEHRQMMVDKTPEQQQKMVEAHVEAMHGTADPKMVAMHRQMMDKHCAANTPAAK